MEDTKIRRGIDFRNRLWQEGGLATSAAHAFAWWKGGKLNKTTIFFLSVVFALNLYFVFPVFTRDVSASFSSSAALLFLAGFFLNFGLNAGQFFSFLTIISLAFSPIAFYLFVRRTAMRHELIALLATLLYILPTPIFKDGSYLAWSILGGDGAHALIFAFIPLFLLYVRAFIATGVSYWGVGSIIGLAAIAIISPFAFFNLLIILFVITVAEGFVGNLRIKLARLFFLLLFSFTLSFFWYYPNIVTKIILLEHVAFSIQKLWSILPLAIPIIPVIGALFFLIFDRRERLKPIFISLSLFLIYSFLFTVSRTINTTGIFTAERYILEISFATSFFLALIFILFAELLARNYLAKVKNLFIYYGSIFTASLLVAVLAGGTYLNAKTVRETMYIREIINPYNLGIGNISRVFNLNEISSILASLISFATFIFLMFILRKSASIINIKEVTK